MPESDLVEFNRRVVGRLCCLVTAICAVACGSSGPTVPPDRLPGADTFPCNLVDSNHVNQALQPKDSRNPVEVRSISISPATYGGGLECYWSAEPVNNDVGYAGLLRVILVFDSNAKAFDDEKKREEALYGFTSVQVAGLGLEAFAFCEDVGSIHVKVASGYLYISVDSYSSQDPYSVNSANRWAYRLAQEAVAHLTKQALTPSGLPGASPCAI